MQCITWSKKLLINNPMIPCILNTAATTTTTTTATTEFLRRWWSWYVRGWTWRSAGRWYAPTTDATSSPYQWDVPNLGSQLISRSHYWSRRLQHQTDNPWFQCICHSKYPRVSISSSFVTVSILGSLLSLAHLYISTSGRSVHLSQ